MPEFTILHLFAGIGGGALGFQQALNEYRGVVKADHDNYHSLTPAGRALFDHIGE